MTDETNETQPIGGAPTDGPARGPADAAASGPNDDLTAAPAPGPVPAEPAAQPHTRLRDRVLGIRGVAAVAVATLVLGGLGGAAVGALADGSDGSDGDQRGPGHSRFGPGQQGQQGLLPGGRGGFGDGDLEDRDGLVPGTTPQEDSGTGT